MKSNNWVRIIKPHWNKYKLETKSPVSIPLFAQPEHPKAEIKFGPADHQEYHLVPILKSGSRELGTLPVLDEEKTVNAKCIDIISGSFLYLITQAPSKFLDGLPYPGRIGLFRSLWTKYRSSTTIRQRLKYLATYTITIAIMKPKCGKKCKKKCKKD